MAVCEASSCRKETDTESLGEASVASIINPVVKAFLNPSISTFFT